MWVLYNRICCEKDKRLADEISDCSNQEQLFLVIRYFDSHCVKREEFLGFLHFDFGLSGKGLDETALGGRLINSDLDRRNVRGKDYDKAASVSELICTYLQN